ncbi:MAG: [protein-PII] uridylyltransferase [Bacteroidetes bacterium]|nr:[protein-PII] uridylyltransferase [Bacteroidota bacterium]MCL5267937.1 [protein-PII] uridylyltransferase [Bacteroidota bacterium]
MREEIALALEKLDAQRQAARKLHNSGGKGSEVSMALTGAVDEAIRKAVEETESREELAAVAVGGYGRAELCPQSDVDVLFIVGNGIESSFLAQRVMHFLWDMGLNIGHSVRNVGQVLGTYRNDHDSWAATLEYRYVAGSMPLFSKLDAAIRAFIGTNHDRSFVVSTLDGIKVRHNKYGKSTSLLEPNVKKSAGGLRDIHALLWMYRSMYLDFLPEENSSENQPAVLFFLHRLLEKGIINQLQFHHTADAFEFILRTRQSLHFQSSSLNDLLDFEIQKRVAADMGYVSADYSKGVESFMRDYFRHARKIYRLNQVVSDKLRAALNTSESGKKTEYLDDDYALAGDKIAFRREVGRDPVRLFRAFQYKAKTGLHFDENVHETLARELDIFSEPKFHKSAEAASIFRTILLSEKNVAFTLKSMNELGILGRYLPEFGKLIGFFQHNVYHYYTADEHTLTAIENLESVGEQDAFLDELLRTVVRRDTLYLGIIFHDIAKPISIGRHEIIGVDVAEKALGRIGFEDMMEDVGFLVRNHLKMEQIAFRRNIGDPETVFAFTRIFANAEQLKMLYLLTYADLSAVNPTVWTKWKAQLLRELYLKSYRIINESLDEKAVVSLQERQREQREQAIINQMPSEKSDAVRKHFESIKSDLYAIVFEDQEIVRHIETIDSGIDIVHVHFSQNEGYTDVTMIAKDAPFQLARFCSSLSANDANIVDANIFTRDDGMIIDRFKVFDNITKHGLTETQTKKIESDLRGMLTGETDPDRLFEQHRMRWQRRLKNEINPNVKVAVQTSEAHGLTLLEVFAPDSLGFLYKVTSALSTAGISIHFAKIATRVDGIVDTFYVSGSDGTRPSQEDLDGLRRQILRIIQESIESELILK